MLSRLNNGIAVAASDRIDHRDRHVERLERAQHVHLLPAVVVLAPHVANAQADVAGEHALDEGRGLVHVGVAQIGIDLGIGDAAETGLQRALFTGLVDQVGIQIVPDVIAVLIAVLGFTVSASPTPGLK